MAQLKHRLPASTLLEVIVAMAIILIVFSIAMAIFNNVFRMSLSTQKLKAEAMAQGVIAQEPAREANWSDQDWRVEQHISDSAKFPGMLEYEVKVYAPGGINTARVIRLIRK